MDFDAQTKDLYEKHFTKHDELWPDIYVIQFMGRAYKNITDKSSISVMDYGCGAGKNTWAMVKNGYNVYAVDYAKSPLKLTKEKVDAIGKNAVYIQNNGIDIPLSDETIDCTIAWGSLFLITNRLELMKSISRVMKKDGLFFANWRSTEDDYFGRGKEVSKNTFVLDERTPVNGALYYFADIEALRELYATAGFEIYDEAKLEHTTDNMTKKNSYWHISARKI